MTNNKCKFFILTGDPGVGKTTIISKLSSVIREKGIPISGFYTEEIRRNRLREGFDVVTLDGKRGKLARDQSLLSHPHKYKVGKYGVLLEEFERVALPSLNKIKDVPLQVLVVDEIGKMEFFSEPFKARIKEIFSPSSECLVLATIPIRKSDQIIENIRHNNQAKIWTVTRDNRNTLLEDILGEIEKAINCT